jgi:hypothetical protein
LAEAVGAGDSDLIPKILREYMAAEWPAYMKGIESVIPNPVMRVIPVNAKVDAQSQILAFDDVKESIESARSLKETRPQDFVPV